MNKINMLLNKMKAKKTERESIENNGYVIMYEADHTGGTLPNIYTVGIPETMGQRNIQCVMPVPPRSISLIIHVIYDMMKNGTVFVAGANYYGIVDDWPIRFKEFTDEEGTEYLRLLVVDPFGKFPDDEGCLFPFNLQLLNRSHIKISKKVN